MEIYDLTLIKRVDAFYVLDNCKYHFIIAKPTNDKIMVLAVAETIDINSKYRIQLTKDEYEYCVNNNFEYNNNMYNNLANLSKLYNLNNSLNNNNLNNHKILFSDINDYNYIYESEIIDILNKNNNVLFHYCTLMGCVNYLMSVDKNNKYRKYYIIVIESKTIVFDENLYIMNNIEPNVNYLDYGLIYLKI